jgi:uncharacterized protein (TIGR03382 family)
MNAFARTLALGVAGKAQTAAVVATLASLGMSEEAEAVLKLPGQSAQAYLDLGATLENRVGFLKQIGTQGQVGYASVTFINSEYAITSAHLVAGVLQVGGSFQVGTGSNYLSSPGSLVSVTDVLIHPSYQGTNGASDTNNPDIAILRLATPLSGITQAQFGTANPGDVVTSGGYGFAFFAGQPTVPRDGFRRGWNAPVVSGVAGFGIDQWYNYSLFGGSSAPLVNGKVLSGDSGGGVYNSLGQLVGINFGQSGNNLSVGYSSYLDLAQPDVLNWVQSNTIPTPAALTLLGLGALVGSRRRRD